MIKVILAGATGQMGQAISRLASRRTDMKIIAGVSKETAPMGYKIYDDARKCAEKADVMIDFSHPSALAEVLELCLSRKMPLVIGTTGFSPAQTDEIKKAAKEIPIFLSSNMSTGMLFFHKLLKMAAKELYGRYDIEIVEQHHNQKVDAPSGTAAALFNTVKAVVPDAEPVYERHSVSKKRVKNEVGVYSVRGGGIVGNHEVIFAGANDCITLSHSAFSKDIFAAGALDAAVIMAKKSAGLYNMNDLFGN